MTDRLEEIRVRARRALYGHEIVRRVVLVQDIDYLLAEVERLRAAAERAFGNVNARNETLEAEVERLRAALTDVSFRCERCGLDFAADGIDATNRCYQCHNDVHFGQPTVQWNPILGDIGNTTITKGGES